MRRTPSCRTYQAVQEDGENIQLKVLVRYSQAANQPEGSAAKPRFLVNLNQPLSSSPLDCDHTHPSAFIRNVDRMDPLSITTACLALLSAVGKTSLAVTTFIRGCREARSDLTSISGELTQLHLVLDLLKDDASVSDGRVIPQSLQAQILSIIKNCSAVVDSINTVLQNHSGKTGVAKWVAFGKAEVAGLRMSLEAHRGSLSLVLELVSVSMSKAIMDDVAVVRNDVLDIKQDTSQIPQIMAELTRLRAIVAAGDIPTTTKGQNYVLEQYLDSLTSYAETVCNDVVWDSDGSRHTPSRKPSFESVGDSGEPSNAHSGGGVAELPTEHSDKNDNHESSQLSTTAAARTESPIGVAISTSGQAPNRASELAYLLFVPEPDSPTLHGDVVSVSLEAERNNHPPHQVVENAYSQTPQTPPIPTESAAATNPIISAPSEVNENLIQNFTALNLADETLATTREKRPNHDVSYASHDKNLTADDASTARNYEYTYAPGPSNEPDNNTPVTDPSTAINWYEHYMHAPEPSYTLGFLGEYDPFNFTTTLTRHIPAAAQPYNVVVLPHEDSPTSNSTEQPQTNPAMNHGRERSEIMVTSEVEVKYEAAPLPAISPADEPEIAAIESAPSTSAGAELRRKLFIVGDGAIGKSTLYM